MSRPEDDETSVQPLYSPANEKKRTPLQDASDHIGRFAKENSRNINIGHSIAILLEERDKILPADTNGTERIKEAIRIFLEEHLGLGDIINSASLESSGASLEQQVSAYKLLLELEKVRDLKDVAFGFRIRLTAKMKTSVTPKPVADVAA